MMSKNSVSRLVGDGLHFGGFYAIRNQRVQGMYAYRCDSIHFRLFPGGNGSAAAAGELVAERGHGSLPQGEFGKRSDRFQRRGNSICQFQLELSRKSEWQ